MYNETELESLQNENSIQYQDEGICTGNSINESSNLLNDNIIVDSKKEEIKLNYNKISQWTTDQVLFWLKNELKLPRYIESFKLNEIDGKTLLILTKQDLKDDLNISNLYDRKKIIQKIEIIKQNLLNHYPGQFDPTLKN